MPQPKTAVASDNVQSRRSTSSLAIPLGLFALALFVRCVGLTWGLPWEQRWYSFHPDERDIAFAVLRLDFFSGDFNPNFYNYPSLFIYLIYLAHMMAGLLGLTHELQPNSTTIWPLLHDVILAGRSLSALLGAATIPLVFAIGKRAAGAGVGVLGALFLALLPGHVQHSHFATVDIPATFFVTLSLWFAVRALPDEDKRTRQLLFAAGAAGLAAATKYNAGLVIVAPVIVLFQLQRAEQLKAKSVAKVFAGIIGTAIAFFILGCPGSVLYTREFLGDGQYAGVLYELLVHSRQGHGEIFVGSGNGWWYHLTFNLPFIMTWPLLIAALFGIAYTIFIRKRNTDGDESSSIGNALLPLLVWLAIYFITTGLSQVRFMRYMLPLAPVLCVLAAVGVLRWRFTALQTTRTHPAQQAIAAAVLIVAALGTYNVMYSFAATDPRDAAANFLKAEVTTPTTVGLIEPPWFWSPPLTPQDYPPPRLETPPATSPDGRYRFVFTGFNAAALTQQKPQWFVLSEFEWTDKERLQNPEYSAFAQAISSNYELVKSFKHQPPATLPGRRFVPHDYLYTNPEVRIYRFRSTPGS